MKLRETSVPGDSQINAFLGGANFGDAFEVVVPATDKKIDEIYLEVFANMPDWFKVLFKLRNTIVRPLGLRGPKPDDFDDVDGFTVKESYAPGDRIGLFGFYALDENELIAGGDDKHLDFRCSALKTPVDGGIKITVSTIVKTHNLFGRIYLRTISPFHKLGVRTLLGNWAAKQPSPLREKGFSPLNQPQIR